MRDRHLSALLFDLDGTLVNTGPLILHSFAETVAQVLGVDMEPSEYLPGVGIPLRAQMERIAVAHLTGDIRQAFGGARMHESATAGGVGDAAGNGLSNVQLQEAHELAQRLTSTYRHVNERLHDSLIAPFEGVEAELQALADAGIPMGVVTSKRDDPAWRDLGHFGLDRYFEVLVGADSVDRHKPDPYPLVVALEKLAAAERTTLKLEETAYIGDSPYDLIASHGAGTLTVAVVWGMFAEATLLEHEPDLVLCAPGDLNVLRLSPAERAAWQRPGPCIQK